MVVRPGPHLGQAAGEGVAGDPIVAAPHVVDVEVVLGPVVMDVEFDLAHALFLELGGQRAVRVTPAEGGAIGDHTLGVEVRAVVRAASLDVVEPDGVFVGAVVFIVVIGVVVEISTLWIPADLRFAAPLVVLIIILLFRPQGILGRRERIG